MTSKLRGLGLHLMPIILASSIFYAVPAHADETSAKRVVKAMSDYMASQKNISGAFDIALDVTTPQLERVTFNSSGSLLVERPGNIRAIRKGGYSEMELISDGRMATVIDLANGAYAQATSPGTIDAVVDMLRTTYAIEMPAGDLLMTNSSDRLMQEVIEAKHIGVGVVDGYVCEHLAFRNKDTDWQLWVRAGPRPLPCKYLISSKTIVGYPTYTIQFRDWSVGRAAGAGSFRFKPAPSAKRVEFDQMSAAGELPAPARGN